MKRDNYQVPVRVIAILGGMALFAACQDSPSEFTKHSSQVTSLSDIKPGSSGETGLAREGGGMPEGIGRTGGHYYYIHNGSAVRLFQRQRFDEGYSYNGHGRIMSGNGKIFHLADGEMVTFAGHQLPLPPGISYP